MVPQRLGWIIRLPPDRLTSCEMRPVLQSATALTDRPIPSLSCAARPRTGENDPGTLARLAFGLTGNSLYNAGT
jgi:hypothetical protein